ASGPGAAAEGGARREGCRGTGQGRLREGAAAAGPLGRGAGPHRLRPGTGDGSDRGPARGSPKAGGHAEGSERPHDSRATSQGFQTAAVRTTEAASGGTG